MAEQQYSQQPKDENNPNDKQKWYIHKGLLVGHENEWTLIHATVWMNFET